MTVDKPRPIIIKKKIVRAEGHHGGSWKIAYADFATAMMSLFIVLWMMNSNAKVKEAVAGYFKDPAGKGKMNGTAMEGRDKTALAPGNPLFVAKDVPPGVPVGATKPQIQGVPEGEIKPKKAGIPEGVQKPEQPGASEGELPKPDMEKLKSQLEKAVHALPNYPAMKNNILVAVTEEGVRMELMETSKGLFFPNGSPTPTKEGREVISAVTPIIGKLPNRVVIEGHTDSIPYVGSGQYTNWELSSERANAARALMIGGLRKDQLFEIRGFADQQLRLPDKAGDPSNRRISIIVLNLPKKVQAPQPTPNPKPPERKDAKKSTKRFIFF